MPSTSTPSNSGVLHFSYQKLYLGPRCAALLTARCVPNSSWSREGHDPNASRILFHCGFPRQEVMTRILLYPHILCPILKATRLHIRVCGVLCIRPSSTTCIYKPSLILSIHCFLSWLEGRQNMFCDILRLPFLQPLFEKDELRDAQATTM